MGKNNLRTSVSQVTIGFLFTAIWSDNGIML